MRQYAAGERDFRNANLRGVNFQEQNLSGADFSGADIRSANFTNANLRGVNFTQTQAGLQRRWMAVQLLLITVIAVVAGFLQAIAGALAAFFLDPTNFNGLLEQAIGLGTYIFLILSTHAAITFQGFTIRALGYAFIVFAVSGAVAGAVAVSGAVSGAASGAGTGVVAFAFAVSSAFAVSFAISGIGAVSGTGIGTFAAAVAVSSAVSGTGAVIGAVSISGTSTGTVLGAISISTLGLLLSLYVGWRVLKEDEKFEIVRGVGLALAAIGGTSFRGGNLTGANFSKARLKSAKFVNSYKRETVLTYVCWKSVSGLNRACLGRSILQNKRVRMLLTVPEKGYKQDLCDANLRGANLNGVTLESTNLTRAILRDALLTNTVLKNAILTEAQAINADFTGACLTGATLEAWNIDSTTTLKKIDCQYVFLRETPDARGNRERRPHNPDKVFQPGDFEKFFKEMLDEVQILIRNGIDPIAFRAALQQLMEQNPDITQDAIKSVAKQGEDVLVTLQVPEGTDKGKVEQDFDNGYQLGLTEGRTAAMLESAPKFEKLAFLLAEKDMTTIQRTEVMTGNDQSQRINIQGNVNQSAVTLGDSNQVSNQINQLGETETQAQLKNLLNQLQAAIESEPALSEEEKTEALVEVGEIAAAGQSPTDGPMKKAAKRSLNALKGITLGLDETTKLATTAKGLLNAIALLFSL
nr:pentapeptide repeat-containing protein [cf. Phormidesmis sp. LEGE 11477]